MRVLWERGTASTAEVALGMAGERDLAHTTVATLLSRLEKRRLVSSKRDGRQLVYRARVSEAVVQRSMVSGRGADFYLLPSELPKATVRRAGRPSRDLNRPSM